MALLAKDAELISEPGERYRYLDLGCCILAYLTETVSGMPFEDYVVKEIMQPVGMTHSGYDLPIAQGYHCFFGRQTELNDVQPPGNAGAALVVTTPSDMVLWMQAQLGQPELPEHLANAIAASHERDPAHRPKENPDSDYFNGWHQSADGIIWHSGCGAAIRACHVSAAGYMDRFSDRSKHFEVYAPDAGKRNRWLIGRSLFLQVCISGSRCCAKKDADVRIGVLFQCFQL